MRPAEYKVQDPLFRYRATGRTHRMLKEALEYARTGKTCYILLPGEKYFDHPRSMLLDMLTNQYNTQVDVSKDRVRVNQGEIRFISVQSDRWDWRANRLEGVSRETPLFIDHHTYELCFQNVIHGWLKYNL